MNSVLAASEVAGAFSLLAWRSVSVAAEPGLMLRVQGGVLRLRAGDGGAHRILGTGDCFVGRRAELIDLKAYTNTELRIEWPCAQDERLSPGLEPIDWAPEPRRAAMEPIALGLRP
jgi:hypothetical protein